MQVCRWLEEAGVDAIHVSTGSSFPHPRNPAGRLPGRRLLSRTYDTLLSSGTHTFRNYLLFRTWPFSRCSASVAGRGATADRIEGINLAGRARDQAGRVGPRALHRRLPDRLGRSQGDRRDGDCDARHASPGRWSRTTTSCSHSRPATTAPPRPCTYCNKCLVHVVENPLGCYEESRFPSREEMLREMLSVYQPPAFA